MAPQVPSADSEIQHPIAPLFQKYLYKGKDSPIRRFSIPSFALALPVARHSNNILHHHASQHSFQRQRLRQGEPAIRHLPPESARWSQASSTRSIGLACAQEGVSIDFMDLRSSFNNAVSLGLKMILSYTTVAILVEPYLFSPTFAV
jgi:hypothetical protein